MGGNRLNWDLANRRTRARRNGSQSVFEDLPATGSYADRARYFERSKKRDARRPTKPKPALVKCPKCGALVKKLSIHINKARATVDSAHTAGKQSNPSAMSPGQEKQTKPAQAAAPMHRQPVSARKPAMCPFYRAKASDLHDHIKAEHGSALLVRWILSG